MGQVQGGLFRRGMERFISKRFPAQRLRRGHEKNP